MISAPDPNQLEEKILTLIRAQALGDQEFNAVALEIFKHQYQFNLPYRNYCEALGKSPEKLIRWQEIPTVSTDAFKLHRHPLTTFPAESASQTFLTSGTTQDIKGRHFFPSLSLYEASILSAWKSLNLPQPSTLVFLTAQPEHAPNSSLSHMMGVLADYYGSALIVWAINEDGGLDELAIEKIMNQDAPVAMLGTALAFLHLFENHHLKLPTGSFAMETGGYKGTKRHLEKADLYSLFETKLGLSPDSVINEYSMTELSSQFYTCGLGAAHHGQTWTRTRVINPLTGDDAASGQPGHLAIYDLANLHSVMAIQTQDIAIAGENGSFTLLGRDPSALPRGCSRAADHTLQPS